MEKEKIFNKELNKLLDLGVVKYRNLKTNEEQAEAIEKTKERKKRNYKRRKTKEVERKLDKLMEMLKKK